LLIADDAAAFAGAIASLLDDRSLRHRLIGPAFDLVAREYDLSAAQRQIEAILARFGLGARVNA
jgi:glycosyltransferase involved in cell wall biosynthesis